MLILAVETVTRRGSVALVAGAIAHAEIGPEEPTHGERLPADVVDWLTRHGQTLHDVDLLAVVTGPGSFTGMRIGIATVQGLALASGRHVVGVPTLDALAQAWWDSTGVHDAIVIPTADGQRGDVFVEILDARGARRLDECVLLAAPRVTTPAALVAALSRGRFEDDTSGGRIDAGKRAIVFAGDGALRYAELFRAVPGAAVVDPETPLAEAAARIAEAHPERATAPHALRPIYLRRPDAEIARDRAAAAREPAYQIRRAAITDNLGPVETLQRQTFTNPWGAEAIRWELENTDVARLYVMYAPEGTLVAYCACWMIFDELHINSLAVDISKRRQGLARKLLAFVLAEAVAAGARSATLEVRGSNAAARGLYESLGFKVEGIRRDYYQDPREDAVILWTRGLGGAGRHG